MKRLFRQSNRRSQKGVPKMNKYLMMSAAAVLTNAAGATVANAAVSANITGSQSVYITVTFSTNVEGYAGHYYFGKPPAGKGHRTALTAQVKKLAAARGLKLKD